MTIRIEGTVFGKVVWKEERCLVSQVVNERRHCININCMRRSDWVATWNQPDLILQFLLQKNNSETNKQTKNPERLVSVLLQFSFSVLFPGKRCESVLLQFLFSDLFAGERCESVLLQFPFSVLFAGERCEDPVCDPDLCGEGLRCQVTGQAIACVCQNGWAPPDCRPG